MTPAHEITIESLGGLGDGISRLGGKPLFVEKAAAGDRLKIRIIHETKEALRGEIVEILSGGPDRVTPPCPHFSQCGGCSLQQLSEQSYKNHKRKVLADALAHAGFPGMAADVVFLPAASRRRVELKWHQATSSFAFYVPRSRDLVPINNCLILEPALQALMAPLSQALGRWEQAAQIKAVSLTAADNGVDMTVETVIPAKAGIQFLSPLAESLSIARIALNEKTIVARAPVTMRLGDYDIALPPDAFLQASREGQRLLTEAVLSAVITCPAEKEIKVADLFCGIGTYSFPLSKRAIVHGVESNAAMVRALKESIAKHGLKQRMSGETRDLFKSPLSPGELEKFDAVVINPPRPGAKAQCEALAKSNVKKVVMVSCNPASFARDAKILKNAGFSLVSAQAIDQFVYSPHLEIASAFGR